MNRSGPNTPCPCCGRVKRDLCRWDDNKLLCYVGQTCGPPQDLVLGKTIDIAGQKWALAKKDCGFSGNSWLFIRDDPNNAPVTNLSPQDLRRQAVALMLQRDQFEHDAELAATALRHVEALPIFGTLPPAQVRDALALCSDAELLLSDLLVRCRRLRRSSPDIGAVANQLQTGLKAVRYQHADLRRWWHDELLDPGGRRGQRLAQHFIQSAINQDSTHD